MTHRGYVFDLPARFLCLTIPVGILTALAVMSPGQVLGQADRNIGEAIQGNLARGVTRMQFELRQSSGPASFMALAADGRALATLLADGSVRVWDLDSGTERLRVTGGQPPTAALPLSGPANRGRAAIGRGNGAVEVAGARPQVAAEAHGASVSALAGSVDGKWLVSGDRSGGLRLRSADALSTVAQFRLPAAVARLAIGPGGDRMAAVTVAGEAVLLELPDLREVARRALGAAPLAAMVTAEGEARIALADGRAIAWAAAGEPRVMAGAGSGATSAAFSPDGTAVAFGLGAGRIVAYDLATGRETASLNPSGGAALSLAFARDRAGLFAGTSDGAARLWDLERRRDVLRLQSTTAGWIVIDHQGRFDGSESGIGAAAWTAKGLDLSLESFARTYFEPGLLSAHVDRQERRLHATPGSPIEGIRLPPQVEIDLPERPKSAGDAFTAIVVAEDRGGGIGELRLYHNGKLVEPGALVQEQQAKQAGRSFRVAAYRVVATAGTNTLRGAATGDRQVEGLSKRETIQVAGQPLPSTLHIVAFAVNKYRARELTLGYSVGDADAFVERVKRATGDLFASVRERKFYDARATRDGIAAALAGMTDVQPQDVVIIYFAGHGVLIDEEWAFLPQDVRFSRNVRDYLPQGFTGTAIQDAMVTMRAQRILLAIDSCHSGGGIVPFESRQDFHRRLFREVSRASGVTILAASRWDQSAAELNQLGHGVFTYVALEGLAGGADREKDGVITAHELTDFVAERLPNLSEQYLNQAQEPAAFTLGADFALVRSR